MQVMAFREDPPERLESDPKIVEVDLRGNRSPSYIGRLDTPSSGISTETYATKSGVWPRASIGVSMANPNPGFRSTVFGADKVVC
jgi:hypothetical protein